MADSEITHKFAPFFGLVREALYIVDTIADVSRRAALLARYVSHLNNHGLTLTATANR